MAVSTSRVSGSTIAQLRIKVRRMVGDLAVDSSAVEAAPATANQRHPDTAVDQAIIDSMSEMYNRAGVVDSAQYMKRNTSDLSYSATPTALADEYAAAPIVRVDLIGSSGAASTLERADALRSQDHQPDAQSFGNYAYILLDRSIQIQPTPASTLTLRVYYIANPFTVPSSADTSPYPAGHEELICLGAAMRLERIDGKQNQLLLASIGSLMEVWLTAARLFRGRRYPAETRRLS